jgi:hypothetical protein
MPKPGSTIASMVYSNAGNALDHFSSSYRLVILTLNGVKRKNPGDISYTASLRFFLPPVVRMTVMG